MKKILFNKMIFVFILAFLVLAGSVNAKPWKFGVMGDTQWTVSTDPANANPYTVSVSIIDQINRQFIDAGVKFVIQVGDLTDDGNDISVITRAKAAQALIDAGIGFFPMRGNHETYGNNNNYGIPAFQSNFPQTQTGVFTKTSSKKFKVGSNFSSPVAVSADLKGMTYSFDYGDREDSARFVMMDTWATPSKVDNNPDGYAYGYTVNDQQSWISGKLNKATRQTRHAFIFAHQPLIAENHQDTMFSGYTNANTNWQDAFYASLQNNNVKYFISGHDHINQLSLVTSPDGLSKVEEIICASNSSKFYTPKPLDDPKWFGQKSRETSIAQEMYTVGYYVYTIDGPRVTVEYYSDNHGNWQSDSNYPDGPSKSNTGITPAFNFVKKATWGYSLNGKEFFVAQGASYAIVQDKFENTTAKILDGTNNSAEIDGSLNTKGGTGRKLTKAVNTGWVDVDRWQSEYFLYKWNHHVELASDIFKLWGMSDLGAEEITDTYVLSLSYDKYRLSGRELNDIKDGRLCLAAKNEGGKWIKAVNLNDGGNKNFVFGPYKPGYELGTYGIDIKTHTIWAVINYTGDFAAAYFGDSDDRCYIK